MHHCHFYAPPRFVLYYLISLRQLPKYVVLRREFVLSLSLGWQDCCSLFQRRFLIYLPFSSWHVPIIALAKAYSSFQSR